LVLPAERPDGQLWAQIEPLRLEPASPPRRHSNNPADPSSSAYRAARLRTLATISWAFEFLLRPRDQKLETGELNLICVNRRASAVNFLIPAVGRGETHVFHEKNASNPIRRRNWMPGGVLCGKECKIT